MNKKLVFGALAVILLAIIIFASNQKSLQNRQEQIHEMGSSVMPFDLDKTTHIFQRTDTGGLQQIRIKNKEDKDQITLIQSHLKKEAERFARGDFDDPSNLHGKNMPGLSILKNSADAFTVEYSDLPDGGQIIYTTDDDDVLNALHMWFMAQMTDHGPDAMDHT